MAAAHLDSATVSNRPDYVAVSTRVDDATIAATMEAFVAGETREVAVGLADFFQRTQQHTIVMPDTYPFAKSAVVQAFTETSTYKISLPSVKREADIINRKRT
ncbi:hypothetical protein HPP92_023359 [Vanilla planifolia]|uniref:Uncharacterized protein n=1 Tax=Vanilla planifolia TaxID=51239 RepID=A0A835PXG9_VANPL|nr:hypothetical protein HPP92_023642 [Vanilla planifolia]KAG0460231.1 hypothetical protein HPP92_023359 [Vanilla planifolia]